MKTEFDCVTGRIKQIAVTSSGLVMEGRLDTTPAELRRQVILALKSRSVYPSEEQITVAIVSVVPEGLIILGRPDNVGTTSPEELGNLQAQIQAMCPSQRVVTNEV